ncbi:MAG: hypothetical protein WBB82_04315 [Limnothrix sp.]
MIKLRVRKCIMPVSALLAFGLASCGVSTADQCNNFSEVVQQGEEFQAEFEAEMQAFGDSFAGTGELEGLRTMATTYRDAVTKVVTKIEVMSDDLAALELPDESLDGYRNRYTEITTQFGQELTKTSEAMGLIESVETEEALLPAVTEFQEKAIDAFTNLETLSAEGDELTTEINEYCIEAG